MNRPWMQSVIDVCQVLVPGVPVYVAHAADHPRLYRRSCQAWTSEDADLQLWPCLRDSGQWSGRGYAWVYQGDDSGDPLADEYLRTMSGLHELAHRLEGGPPPTTEPEDLPAAELQRLRERDVDAESVEVAGQYALAQMRRGERPTGPPPWWQHEVPFLRMFVHVMERARWRGGPIDFERVDLSGYQLSPLSAYRQAMQDELDEKRDCGLIEIAGTPPPPALAALFQRDTKGVNR